MIELVFGVVDFDALKAQLLSEEPERCAVLLASQVVRGDGMVRLLVRESVFPLPEDYLMRGGTFAQLTPAFVAGVTKRARRAGASLIFVHTHPGSTKPAFSTIDDEGEKHLSAFLAHRHDQCVHAALLLNAGGVCARQLGTFEEARVVALGEHRRVHFEPAWGRPGIDEVFDRQVRAFGVEGQRVLEGLRVAVVGLGGTGSLAAQQLVHLGVRKLIFIDPDVIEVTNLNRVVGATPADVGTAKVEVAARYVRSLAEGAEVACVVGDVVKEKVARALFDADVILGCTDSHGSRSVLQQVAYQYLIPCIDIGTTILSNAGNVTGVFGRVQLLAPAHACLNCCGLLDPAEVRRDMMSPFERKSDPYVQGERIPAPAVISINGTAVSLAISMLLSIVVGIPMRGRYLIYNAVNSVLRAIRTSARSDCYICSPNGVLARGHAQRLFARFD